MTIVSATVLPLLTAVELPLPLLPLLPQHSFLRPPLRPQPAAADVAAAATAPAAVVAASG